MVNSTSAKSKVVKQINHKNISMLMPLHYIHKAQLVVFNIDAKIIKLKVLYYQCIFRGSPNRSENHFVWYMFLGQDDGGLCFGNDTTQTMKSPESIW